MAMASETGPAETGWKAQLLRLTVFLAVPLNADVAATLWKTATGEEPEVDDARPREQVRQQGGPFGSCRLDVSVTPQRVDWVMTPMIGPNSLPLAYFSSLEEASEIFVMSGAKWLQIGNPSIRRIAVGAVLLLPSAGKREVLSTAWVEAKERANRSRSSNGFFFTKSTGR